MDLKGQIDRSICKLDLETRIAEAEELDQKNRKELLDKSESELKKIKEKSIKMNNCIGSAGDKPNEIEHDSSAVWAKAYEYINHAEQYYPKFSQVPNRMVQNVKKRSNP